MAEYWPQFQGITVLIINFTKHIITQSESFCSLILHVVWKMTKALACKETVTAVPCRWTSETREFAYQTS